MREVQGGCAPPAAPLCTAPPLRARARACRYVVLNWVRNFEQDIRVWENKVSCGGPCSGDPHEKTPCDPPQIFLPRPPLVRGDGPIMRMRSWIAQFYARGLPKVALALEEPQQQGAQGGAGSNSPAASSNVRSRPAAAGLASSSW